MLIPRCHRIPCVIRRVSGAIHQGEQPTPHPLLPYPRSVVHERLLRRQQISRTIWACLELPDPDLGPNTGLRPTTQILNLALPLFHKLVGVPTLYTFKCSAQPCPFMVPETPQISESTPEFNIIRSSFFSALTLIFVPSPPLEQPPGAKLEQGHTDCGVARKLLPLHQ